jgi:hypothetical protein
MNFKKLSTQLAVFAILCILFLLSGCMGPDIAVMDVATGKTRHPGYSSGRQILVGVDDSNQCFRTMGREQDHLVIRTFDKTCREINRGTIPLFASGFCRQEGRALSPDGRRIVYYKDSARDLCLYDLDAGQETVVWTNIARFSIYVPKIEWLSNSELLVVLRGDSDVAGSRDEIGIFDLVSGGKKVLVYPCDIFSSRYDLSPDRRFLAYQDKRSKHSIYGDIKVLDLKSGLIVATIGSGKDELMGAFAWSHDGTKLAYVEGPRLSLFHMDDGSSHFVRLLGERVTSYALIMGEDLVISWGGEANRECYDLPLVVIDAKSGKILKKLKPDINGQMRFLESDRTIVVETGF